MDNSYREALTEVDAILEYTPEEYLLKLPNTLKNFIKENKSQDYQFIYDENLNLDEQDLKPETKSFIAILLLKYWDKENAQNLKKEFIQNEKIYQEQLREKYNPDIFKTQENNINIHSNIVENNGIEEVIEQEETSLIEYKKNIFSRIFDKIKNFFSKK